MQGERVGSYVITELLGQGGMGAVYLAEHELLHRQAAIKMLLPAVSADQEVIDRFFDEARATTAIKDPGIVQIFDFGYHTDGRAYLVMEHLEGETLDMRLEGLGCLEPSHALRITRQIATSLEAAHRRGVIHRDLKLENVFLVRDPAVVGGERAKILDFGIAKLQRRGDGDAPRSRTRTGSIMGTPLYMSPEQCRDAHEIDGRSDVYALGCLLFCMVTGRAPFDYPSAGEIIAAHLKEDPPRASVVNPDLDPSWANVIDQVILRCMAKSPADRYPSMADLAGAIREVLDEPTGVHVLPPRNPTPTPLGSGTWSPLAVSLTMSAGTVSSLARPTTLSTAHGETERRQRVQARWRGAVTGLALLALVFGGGAIAMSRGMLPGGSEPATPPAQPATAAPAPVDTAPAPAPVVTVPSVIEPPPAMEPIAATIEPRAATNVEPPPLDVAAPVKPVKAKPPKVKAAASTRIKKGEPKRAHTDDERPEDVNRGD